MSEGKDDCWTFSGCDPNLSRINANFADLGRVCDLPNIPSADFPRVDADVSFPPNWGINLTGDGTITITPEGSGGSGSGGSGSESGSGSGSDDSGGSGSGSGSGGSGSGGSGSGSGSDDPGGSGSGSGGSGSGGGGSGSGGSGSGSGPGGSGSGSGGSGSGSGGSGSGGSDEDDDKLYPMVGVGDISDAPGWRPRLLIGGYTFCCSAEEVWYIRHILQDDEQPGIADTVTSGVSAQAEFNEETFSFSGTNACSAYPGTYLPNVTTPDLHTNTYLRLHESFSVPCIAPRIGYLRGGDRLLLLPPKSSLPEDMYERYYNARIMFTSTYSLTNHENGPSTRDLIPDYSSVSKSLPEHDCNAILYSEVGPVKYDRLLSLEDFTVIPVGWGLPELPDEIERSIIGIEDSTNDGLSFRWGLSELPDRIRHTIVTGNYESLKFSNTVLGINESTTAPYNDRFGPVDYYPYPYIKDSDEYGRGRTSVPGAYYRSRNSTLASKVSTKDVVLPENTIEAVDMVSRFFMGDTSNDLFTDESNNDLNTTKLFLKLYFAYHKKIFSLTKGQVLAINDSNDSNDNNENTAFFEYMKNYLTTHDHYDRYSSMGLAYANSSRTLLGNYPKIYTYLSATSPYLCLLCLLDMKHRRRVLPKSARTNKNNGFLRDFRVYSSLFSFVSTGELKKIAWTGIRDINGVSLSVVSNFCARMPTTLVYIKLISGSISPSVDQSDIDSNDDEENNIKYFRYGDFRYRRPYRIIGNQGNHQWVQREPFSVTVAVLFDTPCIDSKKYNFRASFSYGSKKIEEDYQPWRVYKTDPDSGEKILDENETFDSMLNWLQSSHDFVLVGPFVGSDPSEINKTVREVYKRFSVSVTELYNDDFIYEISTEGVDSGSRHSVSATPAIYKDGRYHVYTFIESIDVQQWSVSVTLNRKSRLLTLSEAKQYYYYTDDPYEDEKDDPDRGKCPMGEWYLDERVNGTEDYLQAQYDAFREDGYPKHPRLK